MSDDPYTKLDIAKSRVPKSRFTVAEIVIFVLAIFGLVSFFYFLFVIKEIPSQDLSLVLDPEQVPIYSV